MAKIRILVVDDSAVMRRLVSEVINGDPALHVVGVAANGRLAQERIEQLKPDLVTMDVEMPEMDGVEAVKELRKRHLRLPVIMFSHLTQRGAVTTMDALAAGASDYVTKPAHVGSVSAGMAQVRDALIPKIKALCGLTEPLTAAVSFTRRSRLRPTPPLGSPAASSRRRVDILAIGVSTGGPGALAKIIPGLPADFPIPIVIVQHMPPDFTRLLAGRLSAAAAITVREGIAGQEIRPGVAWIAPGDYHMVLEKIPGGARIALNQQAAENSCRPAVDPLFRSAAQIYGKATLGLILTGMGRDGLRGCEKISEVGGQILAQDEASSVVWGMPGLVARAGLAEKVLPLNRIADEITRRVWIGRERLSVRKWGQGIHDYLGR